MSNTLKTVVIFWLLSISTTFGKFVQPSANAYGEFFSDMGVLQVENALKTSINIREDRLCDYGDVLGMADYAYCGNDPINKVDVLGLAQKVITVDVAATRQSMVEMAVACRRL